jgi:hypothetical protein
VPLLVLAGEVMVSGYAVSPGALDGYRSLVMVVHFPLEALVMLTAESAVDVAFRRTPRSAEVNAMEKRTMTDRRCVLDWWCREVHSSNSMRCVLESRTPAHFGDCPSPFC